jgi:hypothetical protein
MTVIPKTRTSLFAPVRWRRLSLAETVASDHVSAACYRNPENIGVVAVVISELKFSDVQRQIFCTYLVIAADNAALEDRPEALNRVRVDRADNVLLCLMLNGLPRIFDQPVIDLVFVRSEQRNLVGNHFADEALRGVLCHAAKHTSDNVTFAACRADDRRLAGAGAAGFAVVLLIPMPVAVLAANPRFVHLDNAHELAEFFVLQRRPDAMADVPSGFVRAEADIALHLASAHTLLGGQHEVDHAKPVAKVNVRVFENRAYQMREAIRAAFAAIRALPFEFHGLKRVDVFRATARAMNTLGPAPHYQKVVASLLVWKQLIELFHVHLRNLLGLFGAGHGGSPYRQGRTYHA